MQKEIAMLEAGPFDEGTGRVQGDYSLVKH